MVPRPPTVVRTSLRPVCVLGRDLGHDLARTSPGQQSRRLETLGPTPGLGGRRASRRAKELNHERNDLPVHVDADLDTRLSRWLWLFKWLLVIPHYIVLAFLWLAFVVLSVVAFFGILFTGRYPRSIFEFNVGVLRWSWRVAYYAYGALGTDRYPPFTLHDVARLPRAPRGRVSRAPLARARARQVVVARHPALHRRGSARRRCRMGVRAGNDEHVVWGAGLIGLLVLVAGVTLLFTGRYPQQLFDLVLGLNRWVLRVAGYAGLMTDRYPPFSLDQGGHEDQRGASFLPTAPAPAPVDPSPAPSASPRPHTSAWTGGRVVSLVFGSLLVTIALGLGIPAAALFAANTGARDNDGFMMSGSQSMTTETYALSSTNLALHMDGPPGLVPQAVLGDTKVSASSQNGKDIFVGIAPTWKVRGYLQGVEHSTFSQMMMANEPRLMDHPGVAPRTPPDQANIWTAQSSGPGTQSLVWPPRNGDWSLVVMNADGSAGVATETEAGAEMPLVGWVVGLLLTLAALALVAGVLLIVVPLRSVSKQNARSGRPA